MADRIGVSVAVIEEMETSRPITRTREETLGDARRALKAAGVEFTTAETASVRGGSR